MLIPVRIRESTLEYAVRSSNRCTDEFKDHRAGRESEQEGGSESVRNGSRKERDKERGEQLGQQIDTSKISVLVCKLSVVIQ